jgi:beta-N-acetylhexosaminidase
VVFADDLSMAGAASIGGIVERATRALEAGCDVLPVCNHPPSVAALLDGLRRSPDPATALRLVRLRGRRGAPARDELLASDAWKTCQESLARCAAPPKLSLV